MVLIKSDDSAKIRHKSERHSEVCSEALRSFVRIERSSLPYQVDLRRLEAAEEDSALVSQHAFRSVETQPVGVFQE